MIVIFPVVYWKSNVLQILGYQVSFALINKRFTNYFTAEVLFKTLPGIPFSFREFANQEGAIIHNFKLGSNIMKPIYIS
ncbi:hypothetical protein D3C80_1968970 [compost metagenome]